jgi:hypothetical protein
VPPFAAAARAVLMRGDHEVFIETTSHLKSPWQGHVVRLGLVSVFTLGLRVLCVSFVLPGLSPGLIASPRMYPSFPVLMNDRAPASFQNKKKNHAGF